MLDRNEACSKEGHFWKKCGCVQSQRSLHPSLKGEALPEISKKMLSWIYAKHKMENSVQQALC